MCEKWAEDVRALFPDFPEFCRINDMLSANISVPGLDTTPLGWVLDQPYSDARGRNGALSILLKAGADPNLACWSSLSGDLRFYTYPLESADDTTDICLLLQYGALVDEEWWNSWRVLSIHNACLRHSALHWCCDQLHGSSYGTWKDVADIIGKALLVYE